MSESKSCIRIAYKIGDVHNTMYFTWSMWLLAVPFFSHCLSVCQRQKCPAHFLLHMLQLRQITHIIHTVWTHRTHTWRLCETFAQTNTHYVYIQYGPIVPIHWDFCYSWETNTLCIHTVWTHCTHTLRLMRQQVLRWIYHTTLQRKRQETWKTWTESTSVLHVNKFETVVGM